MRRKQLTQQIEDMVKNTAPHGSGINGKYENFNYLILLLFQYYD